MNSWGNLRPGGEDYWSGTLRSMGSALGRFIYIMDAVIDLDKDAKSGSYNPQGSAGAGRRALQSNALCMLMGSAYTISTDCP